MPVPQSLRATLVVGACLAALALAGVAPGTADARPPSVGGPVRMERPAGAEGRVPRGTIREQPGQVTPEKIERWRGMSPEERDRIRERYRRWKDLPPERRERLMERSRRWRELPERDRRFIRERREMYRNAWPEEKRAIDKFFVRWRQLPPEGRRTLKRRIAEWRALPASERDERLAGWSFYNSLRPEEQKVIRRFLFSEPLPPLAPRE
ncbi:MAG: DUF3106 domain-containing protein [Deltaproteobacteria bacterium]